MVTWAAHGQLTFGETNRVKNQLLEDMELEPGESFKIDCYYMKNGELRYGVRIVHKDDENV
jgi:hypothetical protein